MSIQPLDYPRLVQDALRGVVRSSLVYVQKNGLPGDHHFYLAFATTAPGVSLSEDLRRRYPEQITIVLQHDFRDLDVDVEFFAVTLRFGGIPQRIRVPFTALISFYDPASQFALRFEPELDGVDIEAAGTPEDTSNRAAVRAVLAAADRLAAAKEEALRELGESEDQASAESADGEASPQPAQIKPEQLKPRQAKPPAPGAPSPGGPGSTDMPAGDGSDDSDSTAEEPASNNVVSIDSFRRK